jgi:hypothetical protein
MLLWPVVSHRHRISQSVTAASMAARLTVSAVCQRLLNKMHEQSGEQSC